jgi:branched-chain amino acid transport system substrate-binding protein
MPRVRALFAVAIAAACALLACRSSATSHPTPSPSPTPPANITIEAGQPITIGVSVALSGDAKGLGSDIADSVDLAIADVNGSLLGHPLQSSRMDDGCGDAEKAVEVAHTLVAVDTLVGVVGPMCTTGAQAADKVYEGAAVIHLLPTATRNDLSSQGERYFFRTAWRDDAQAQVQAQYARTTANASSAVVIDDGEPYGTTLADAFSASFAVAGGRVLSRERVERGTIDFGTLTGLVESANPDVVVFEGLNPEAALLVKALRGGGYTGTFVAPDGVLSVRDFIVPGGAATDGAVVTAGNIPDSTFVARFKDRFQREPVTPFVLQARDAVGALIQAITSVATQSADGALTIDRAKLADALRGHPFNGLTGVIQFDANGDRSGDTPAALGLVVYRVSNGRFEQVP